MKILAVDIGTGTQDILLFDPRLDVENGYKLVLPSPTMITRARIQSATRRGLDLALTGVMMGGGPCAWAAEDHLRAGHRVYAAPAAALTFNDDLAAVAAMGIQVLSEDEIGRLPQSVERIEMRDFDYAAIRRALLEFGIDLEREGLACVAAAVFDHGAAPADVSDRQYRFDYLDARIRAENRLSAFAYPAGRIPADMTRLQALAHSAQIVPAPLLVMDTAPAAVLGALYDPAVNAMAQQGPLIVCNIGNFHTIAFRLGPGGIEGVFEHHTGLLDSARLENLLERLAAGSLTHAEVFGAHGHGALVYQAAPFPLAGRLVITGPRRALLAGSSLHPHFAVPYGDMMVSGCFGLLSAAADHLPELSPALRTALTRRDPTPRPPWEAES